MLATFSTDGLRQAVAASDVTALTRVPGIGRKGAQRIVLELAGRLGSPCDGAAIAPAASHQAAWRDQVRTGLVNLGWQPRDADEAIAAIEPDEVDGEVDVAGALRAALRVLGRR
jgi:holliday junction DNA helicase RuvA